MAYNRTTSAPQYGQVTATRNDEDVGTHKALIGYGGSPRESYDATWDGSLTTTFGSAINNQTVGVEQWDDDVVKEYHSEGVPIDVVDTMSLSAVKLTAIDETYDAIFAQPHYKCGKAQTTLLKLSVWNGSAWVLLGSTSISAMSLMFTGFFTVISSSLQRSWMQSHAGSMSYNLKVHSCRSDNSGEVVHDDNIWISQPVRGERWRGQWHYHTRRRT